MSSKQFLTLFVEHMPDPQPIVFNTKGIFLFIAPAVSWGLINISGELFFNAAKLEPLDI